MKTSLHFRHCKHFLAALLCMLGAAFLANQAHAQEAPDALLKRLSHEILETIRNDKELRQGNTQRVREVVKEMVLPHVDFERTTALAVGRHWREATPEQRQRLTEEFHDLLIYTYSGALSLVGDQRLVFRPLRMAPGDTHVEVHSNVIQSGREPIRISYRLEKQPHGWKVYDIAVLGAWLTETYKNTFAAEVRENGIEGLVRALTEKNRQLAGNTAQRQQRTN